MFMSANKYYLFAKILQLGYNNIDKFIFICNFVLIGGVIDEYYDFGSE